MTNHFQQAAAGMMILLMDLQMLGQVADPLGQDGDLYLGGTGVLLIQAVCLNDCAFLFLLQHIRLPLSFKLPIAAKGLVISLKTGLLPKPR